MPAWCVLSSTLAAGHSYTPRTQAIAGFPADGRQIVNRGMAEAQQYKSFYGDSIPGHVLAERLGGYVHLFNLYAYLRYAIMVDICMQCCMVEICMQCCMRNQYAQAICASDMRSPLHGDIPIRLLHFVVLNNHCTVSLPQSVWHVDAAGCV